MSSITRRGGTKLTKVKERATAPSAATDYAQLYAKDVSGTTHLFAMDEAGTEFDLTNAAGSNTDYLWLPELWTQNDVAISQTNVALSSQNSQLFDTFKVARAGRISGLTSRYTGAITAGSVTVTVAINGTPGTLAVTSTSGTGSQSTQTSGDSFVAGDLISVVITTNGTFAPTTTDVECAVEVSYV